MVWVALTEAGEKIAVGAMGESVSKVYSLKCCCSWMGLSTGMCKEVVISDLLGPPSFYRHEGCQSCTNRMFLIGFPNNQRKQGDDHAPRCQIELPCSQDKNRHSGKSTPEHAWPT